MDGLAEFGQPQLLAGLMAIGLLALALAIEGLMLWSAVRQYRSAQVADAPAVAEPAGQDFYDWLYE